MIEAVFFYLLIKAVCQAGDEAKGVGEGSDKERTRAHPKFVELFCSCNSDGVKIACGQTSISSFIMLTMAFQFRLTPEFEKKKATVGSGLKSLCIFY